MIPLGATNVATTTDSDRQEWVARLPLGHAVSLRLHAARHCDVAIATALGLPMESLPTLLEVARVTLEHTPVPHSPSTDQ